MDQKQLDRIEGMLEGLCMGMASKVPYEDPPKVDKTPLRIRREFCEYLAAAAYSYSKYPSTKTIKARIEVDDGYYVEATSRVPALAEATPAEEEARS